VSSAILVWGCYLYDTGDDYVNINVDLSKFSGHHTISFVCLTSEFYGQMMDAITVTTIYQDVNQSEFDRGFPIRHAVDGDWGDAQSFTPPYITLHNASLYVIKFGTSEFDLTVELREDSLTGPLIENIIFNGNDVSADWTLA